MTNKNRKVAFLIAGLVVVIAAGVYLLFTFVLGVLKDSDAYKAAITHLHTDVEAQAQLCGAQTEPDYLAGEVSTFTSNGKQQGTAYFSFDLDTECGSKTVRVEVLQTSAETGWEVRSVTIK